MSQVMGVGMIFVLPYEIMQSKILYKQLKCSIENDPEVNPY